MKKIKKLLTMLVAVVMVLAFNVTAFAGTITINNPAAGENYTAYKLFDVSASGDNYSYSTTNKNLMEALKDLKFSDNSTLSFTKAANEDRWYVSGLDNETEAAALAQYIHTNWETTFSSLLGDGIKAENNVINTGTGTGYYFVTSSLGSLCALNTLTETVTVNEKNTVPSITKKVKEDSANDWRDIATIDVIDTVYYQLTVNTGSNTDNLGTGIDDDYVITDALPEGITYNTGSVAIEGWKVDTDYTVNYNNQNNTLTITLLADGELGELGQNTNIVITYNAKVAANLAVDDAHVNNVTLTYKEQESKDSATVKTYGIGGTAEGATITKVEAGTTTPLEGVKFVLSKVDGETTKYATFDGNKYLTGWVDNISAATDLITDEDGHIFAYGLDAGTYILTETETLPGYNLLDDTITVVITENGDVTYEHTDNTQDNPGPSITIENATGVELPSTGGTGTTIIYIVGAAFVIGAGIVLVVRRRMSTDR